MIGKRAWRRLASERGSVAVEAVLMLPVLIVFYVTSFSFFDAYRTQTVVTKSGYVVGDLLSRRTGIVRSADIAGMRDMMAFLTYAADGTEIRVTELRGPHDDRAPGTIEWSDATGGLAPMTASDLDAAAERIPPLMSGEHVTIVETRTAYRPPFQIGLPAYTMKGFVVTRHRHGRLCYAPTDRPSSCG